MNRVPIITKRCKQMFGGTVPRILNLGLGRRCVSIFTCQMFYAQYVWGTVHVTR